MAHPGGFAGLGPGASILVGSQPQATRDGAEKGPVEPSLGRDTHLLGSPLSRVRPEAPCRRGLLGQLPTFFQPQVVLELALRSEPLLAYPSPPGLQSRTPAVGAG